MGSDLAGTTAGLISRIQYLETQVSDIQAQPNSSNPNYYGVDLGAAARHNAATTTRLTWTTIPGDPTVGIIAPGGYEIEVIGTVSLDAAGGVYLSCQAGSNPPGANAEAPGVAYARLTTGLSGQGMTLVSKSHLALNAGDVISPRYMHDAVASQVIWVEGGLQIFARRIN